MMLKCLSAKAIGADATGPLRWDALLSGQSLSERFILVVYRLKRPRLAICRIGKLTIEDQEVINSKNQC